MSEQPEDRTPQRLTHVREDGTAHMVDVSEKAVTSREATAQAVLVTRGERGMSLFEGNKDSWHIPTQARQVYDVTGAGDTVVGTLALALSIGVTMREAAMLANYAAGVVVGMVGTATVTTKQLSETLGE